MRLRERVAIVSGASQGIGRAIAIGLAREGAAVVADYPPSGPSASEVVGEIEAGGGRAVAVEADVGELSHHDRLIRSALDRFGRLDVLVNNAAVQFREPFLSTRPDAWDHTLAVNLRGPFFLSQRAAEAMIRSGGGKIVNLSSVHDTVPLSERSAYAISKAGIAMLTKALALELAPHGINVNAIAPGAILTDMNRAHLSDPAVRARLVEGIAWGRLGEAGDIVGAAVFLASPDSDYVTGATIYVDGGLLLRRL
jgi:glucose 1-dehydrogenase